MISRLISLEIRREINEDAHTRTARAREEVRSPVRV